MDWNNAKKTVIIILVMLNAFLFFANFRESKIYKITPDREKYAIEVLSKRGVYLYTDIPDEILPLEKISVKPVSVNRSFIEKKFFENEDIKISVEFDKNILRSNKKTVAYKGNKINIEYNQEDSETSNFNSKKAIEFADNMIYDIEGRSNRFSLLDTIETDEGYKFIYCEKYKGHIIYPSRYEIFVNKNGVKSIDIEYCDIDGYTGDKSEIFGGDEAIFTLSDYVGKSITIDKIEICYDYQSNDVSEYSSSSKLVPYYFIYTIDDEKPYMVNAYTNKVK